MSYTTYKHAPHRSRRKSKRVVLGSYLSYFVLFVLLTMFFHAPTSVSAATLSRPPNNLSLVGYWTFDEGVGNKAGDTSGNGRNGSLTSTTWTDGKKSKALSFNGTSSYVDTGVDLTWSLTDSFSMAAWVKSTEAGGNNDSIVSKDNWEYIFYKNGSTIGFNHWNTAGSDVITMTGTVADTSIWHHAVVTYDGSVTTGKLYIDGVLAATDSSNAGTLQDRSETTKIGKGYAWGAGDGFMNGTIDDVRVYNRALSQTEAQSLYGRGSITGKGVSKQGLVGYWPMNEGRGGKAGDASGNGNAGALVGGASWVDGKRGKAISLDGVNGGVSTSLNVGNLTKTISAWVKVNSLSAQNTIVSQWYANPCASWDFHISTSGFLRYYSHNCGSTNSLSSATALSANTYYLVTVTYNASTNEVILYINGAYSNSSTFAIDETTNNAGLWFGRENSTTVYSPFNGIIDDARVYNRVLTAAEIKTMYSEGETQINSSQNKLNGTLDTGLVGLWSFNGLDYNSASTTAEVLDRSGQGNNGDNSGATRAIGKVGQALSFDGSDDYVNVGDPTALRLTSAGTASAWIYPTAYAPASGWRVILNKGNWGGGLNYYSIYFQNSCSCVRFDTGSASATFGISVSQTYVPLNTWSNVTITFDGSNTRAYVNGVDRGSASMTGNPDTSGSNFYIGSPSGGASFFQGKIDETRVYSRALSADEVKQLYNAGK